MLDNVEHKTKLMVNLLSGGKPVNSGVKFANFFLIVDGNLNAGVNVMPAFKSFLTHFKSKFTTGKGGDTAFKCLADGSFFNAYPSIIETFKFVEEAVTVSGVNDKSRENVTSREGTLSSKSVGRSAVASAENSVESLQQLNVPTNVFSLGVNCDADSLYNKDPKDANKYEIEGQKVQCTTQ